MTGEGHQGKFKNSKGASRQTMQLLSFDKLTNFLKLKDEREGAGLACPSFGNCIELFSLVKTLLTIDKTTH